MDKNKSADYYRDLFINLAALSTEDDSLRELANGIGAMGDIQRAVLDAVISTIVKDLPGMLEMMNMFKLSEIEPQKAARFMYLAGVRAPEIGGFNG